MVQARWFPKLLVHTGSNAEHQDAEYELIKGSYNIASASKAKAIVTAKATVKIA